MSARPPGSSFLDLFRRFVPDLGVPDLHGWTRGTCPYCLSPGSWWGNVVTGRWICLPIPPPRAAEDGGRLEPRPPDDVPMVGHKPLSRRHPVSRPALNLSEAPRAEAPPSARPAAHPDLSPRQEGADP
jgi:hypothetical protein